MVVYASLTINSKATLPTLTIIKSKAYLPHYALQAIDDALASRMLLVPTNVEDVKGNALQLFGCHCHCLGEYLSLDSLGAGRLQDLLKSFLGSLHSGDLSFHKLLAKRRRGRALVEMVAGLKEELPGLRPMTWSPDLLPKYEWAWLENHWRVDPEAVEFWGGWGVKSKKGKTIYLKLVELYNTHGPEFTKAFHEAVRRDSVKRCKVESKVLNHLANFISRNVHLYPPEAFQSQKLMEEFFEAYFWNYQAEEWERNQNEQLNLKTWRNFRLLVARTFISTAVWNCKEDSIVQPSGRSTPGADLNIIINKHGIQVKDKLLTEVPLHVTDIGAIDLLYGDIKADLATVKKWALSQILKLRRAQRASVRNANAELALTGADRRRLNLDISTPTGKQNALNTFASEGMLPVEDMRYLYGENLPELAELLGMPTSFALTPFQIILSVYHSEITTTFVEDLELWKGETRVSFIKTNTGYELIGYKDRRGSKNSEQKIILCPRAAAVVRMVEEITQPLRKYLKERRDINYQRLFLNSGVSFTHPKPHRDQVTSNRVDANASIRNMLIEQVSPHTKKTGEDLIDFIKKMNHSRIRAQAAVCDYIQHHNRARLAQKLGHAFLSKDLLDSYLPTAIYDFFATRYVRIFQKGIICEAMKDSKYLFRAAKFSCLEDLHNFLIRYTLKEIPENLNSTGDNKLEKGAISEVGISVSTGSLTALLSLREAVKHSTTPKKVRGLARYWASVCDAVERYIVNSSDSLLLEHLAKARASLTPSSFGIMIHDLS